MNRFCNINTEELDALKKSGITKKNFNNAIPILMPERSEAAFGKVHIMFYIDKFGDFNGRSTPTAKIVNALFKSLDKKGQIDIINYIMESEDE